MAVNSFNEILSVKYLNGLYGFLSVAAFFYLLKKCKTDLSIATAAMFGAVLLIVHFTFDRLFGKLLIILYLNIICSERFGTNYKESF